MIHSLSQVLVISHLTEMYISHLSTAVLPTQLRLDEKLKLDVNVDYLNGVHRTYYTVNLSHAADEEYIGEECTMEDKMFHSSQVHETCSNSSKVYLLNPNH